MSYSSLMQKKPIKTWGANRKRAETLLEVMIALVVLTLGSISATSLILSAINANIYNKDALMALNLAQEGIEYMRNLRDTNWIRFSANRQGCWNVRPFLVTEIPICSDAPSTKIQPADITTTTNDGFALGDILSNNTNVKLNLSDGILPAEETAYRLKYFDLDINVDSDGLDINNDGNGKNDDRDFIGTFYPGAAFVENTKFYRSINLVYKQLNPNPNYNQLGTVGPTVGDLMQVYSTVQWMDGGIMHQIQLTSALSRYKK
jgi:Tfp pilus assembly protein PilV